MFGSLIRRKSGRVAADGSDAAFESTTVSLSTAVPRPTERRDDERLSAMLRVGKLTDAPGERAADPGQEPVGRRPDGDRQPRRRKSASRSAIELSSQKIPATVVWTRDDTGRRQVRPECRPRRAARRPQAAPRLPPAAAAPRDRVQGVGHASARSITRVDVHDISLGGMKVEPIEEYCVGKKVVVVVESLRPIKGEVRWYSDRKAGIVFDEPLEFDELAEWVGKRLELASLKASYQSAAERCLSSAPATEGAERWPNEVAVLAGGCFWCTEAVFLDVVGVKSVESGYTGGTVANPTYKQVCGGDTGHAEAIRITFDPDAAQLRRSARHLLRDPRPDPAQPPGQRRRHAISLGDLPAGRGAGAQGARGDRAQQCRPWRPASSRRSSRRANGIRPRIITRIIGPARGSAIPIASRSSRPSCRSCARASRRG